MKTNNTPLTIGQKIKSIRKEKGIKQGAFDISQPVLSNIESGKTKRPNKDILIRIADTLEITFDSLIEGTDWVDIPQENNTSEHYGICPSCVEITLTDNIFRIKRKTFSLKENSPFPNNYCGVCGKSLITKCSKCNRPLHDPRLNYCQTCGEEIVFKDKALESLIERKTYGGKYNQLQIDYIFDEIEIKKDDLFLSRKEAIKQIQNSGDHCDFDNQNLLKLLLYVEENPDMEPVIKEYYNSITLELLKYYNHPDSMEPEIKEEENYDEIPLSREQ